MSFHGQTDVTDTKHRVMIWDIITWWGLLTGISLLVRQEKRFFSPHLSSLVRSRWLDIGLYGSRGLKRSNLKNADNSEIL